MTKKLPRQGVRLHDESLGLQTVLVVESNFDKVLGEDVLAVGVRVPGPVR